MCCNYMCCPYITTEKEMSANRPSCDTSLSADTRWCCVRRNKYNSEEVWSLIYVVHQVLRVMTTSFFFHYFWSPGKHLWKFHKEQLCNYLVFEVF